MKTKKILFLILSLAVCIALSACAGKSGFDSAAAENAEGYVAGLSYDYYKLVALEQKEGSWARYTYYGYTKDGYIHHADKIDLEYRYESGNAVRTDSSLQKKYDAYWQFDDFVGVWEYNDSDHSFWVNIIEIDEADITFEYRLENSTDSSVVSTDGPLQQKLDYYNDYSITADERVWLYKSGVHVDGCILSKQNK